MKDLREIDYNSLTIEEIKEELKRVMQENRSIPNEPSPKNPEPDENVDEDMEDEDELDDDDDVN